MVALQGVDHTAIGKPARIATSEHQNTHLKSHNSLNLTSATTSGYNYSVVCQQALHVISCVLGFMENSRSTDVQPSTWTPARWLSLCVDIFSLVTNGNRGIDSPADPKSPPNYPFEAIPKAEPIQYRIEEIGQHTVVAVLWIGVMKSVVGRGLDKADTLEKRNYGAVF